VGLFCRLLTTLPSYHFLNPSLKGLVSIIVSLALPYITSNLHDFFTILTEELSFHKSSLFTRGNQHKEKKIIIELCELLVVYEHLPWAYRGYLVMGHNLAYFMCGNVVAVVSKTNATLCQNSLVYIIIPICG